MTPSYLLHPEEPLAHYGLRNEKPLRALTNFSNQYILSGIGCKNFRMIFSHVKDCIFNHFILFISLETGQRMHKIKSGSLTVKMNSEHKGRKVIIFYRQTKNMIAILEEL